MSTYNYAENSPIGNIDLWGLQAYDFNSAFKWAWYHDTGLNLNTEWGKSRTIKLFKDAAAEAAKKISTGIAIASIFVPDPTDAIVLGALRRFYRVKKAGNVAKPLENASGLMPKKKTGGRLGNESTRKQNSEIADELQSRGWEITGGGGKMPEEYIPPVGGGRKGGSYPDITATKDGNTLRINTVDVKKNGKMTKREDTNAKRIRKQKPKDHLLTIPKKKT